MMGKVGFFAAKNPTVTIFNILINSHQIETNLSIKIEIIFQKKELKNIKNINYTHKIG